MEIFPDWLSQPITETFYIEVPVAGGRPWKHIVVTAKIKLKKKKKLLKVIANLVAR